MLARMVGEGISLEVAASQPIGKVLADPNQIEQIILNLAVRAREAMPDGGRLTIATRDERISPEQLADHPGATPGRHVVLSMTDSGADLGEVTRGKLFDPVQAGPGLGMLTVRAIVQQNNGHIRVSGGSGRGTTIEIYLPRADLADDATPPSATLRGTETILLVEDDELVRAALRVVLQKNGYRVLEAQNGGEAIMICEEHQAGIHLLLTDVVMPRMSGREVARRLVDLQPAMKVLYMSGYTEDSILHHGLIDAGFSFLSKPITMETLLRKVRDLLGATAEMGGGVDGA
jgi:CheY-like chemotaxis protein